MIDNEIQLTLNTFMEYRNDDITLLTNAASALGFTVRVIKSFDMYKEDNVPFAVINLSGQPNDTHLRYLRRLEHAGTKVLNPIYNSIIADDKSLSNLEIKHLGMPVPKTVDVHVANRGEHVTHHVFSEVGFPCVVKFPKSGFGVGVHLVNDQYAFDELFDLLYLCNSRSSDYISNVNIVAQEYIANSTGKDVRVVILGGKVFGSVYREKPNSWRVARGPRGVWQSDINYSIIDVDQGTKDSCIKICDSLNLKIAGIDLLIGKDGYVYGEINSFPGMSNFTKFFPDYPELVIKELIK